jgi:hypothetical protein
MSYLPSPSAEPMGSAIQNDEDAVYLRGGNESFAGTHSYRGDRLSAVALFATSPPKAPTFTSIVYEVRP